MVEGALLSFTATASDAETAPASLVFRPSWRRLLELRLPRAETSLGHQPKVKAQVSNTFDVVVSDGLLSDSETITVTVTESNVASND